MNIHDYLTIIGTILISHELGPRFRGMAGISCMVLSMIYPFFKAAS